MECRNGRYTSPPPLPLPFPPPAAAEAVVRGHKLGLLTTADYNNLCQCETLEDIKLYLVLRTAGRGAERGEAGERVLDAGSRGNPLVWQFGRICMQAVL